MMIEIHSIFCISICSHSFLCRVYKYTRIERSIHVAHFLWHDAVFFYTSHYVLVWSSMPFSPISIILSVAIHFCSLVCLLSSYALLFPHVYHIDLLSPSDEKHQVNRIRFIDLFPVCLLTKCCLHQSFLSYPNESDDTYI